MSRFDGCNRARVLENHVRESNSKIWVSDAVQFAIRAYSMNSAIHFRVGLTQKEMKLSSGHRELLAVLKMLQMVAATAREKRSMTVY